MKREWWAALAASLLIAAGGGWAAWTLGEAVPAGLDGRPLLAAVGTAGEKQAGKTIKDIIFETQKQVVMIETPTGSQGSGFLYNWQGDLLTNAHVVAGSRTVKVKTADARELRGEVIGIGTDTDIAVVRVKALEGTEPLSLKRSAMAEVGDEVVAVGSPLGLQNTVTTGIISGVGRHFEIGSFRYRDMYQISAPIAPGNSGGPLVDRMTGSVIGINSAGVEKNAIGFSMPIDNVIAMAEEWSANPMTELPGISADIGTDEGSEFQLDKMAEYLVRHFYDSLNSGDYVYAYTLLGSEWKEKTSYEAFREGYLQTKNVKLDNLRVDVIGNETADVTAIITADERSEGTTRVRKYQVSYRVGFENDQLKLLDGKGRAIDRDK